MHLTDHQSKFFAHELTKRCSSDSLEKLAGAVASAQVDLNPHQIEDVMKRNQDGLIAATESKLRQRTSMTELFAIRWAVS